MKKLILLSLILVLSSLCFAETAQDKGLSIAQEADRRDLGWQDNNAQMKMTLRNRNGQESKRRLRRWALEVAEAGKGDKSIVLFDHPKDIEGTALLSHTKTVNPDDQWLYLPALKRVKRISSGNKSGPFVGSEFAYEDLVSQELDKYSYLYLKDEVVQGLDSFVVERTPEYKNSGYARQLVWYDKDEYRPQKIEFYDRKNTLLKTLRYEGYRKYGGKFWRASMMKMVNHQTGKSTDLAFADWKFGVGQTVSDFTPNKLKRRR